MYRVWYFFQQLAAVLFTTGLIALGVTIGLYGDLIGREPSPVQFIMAIPAAIMHPNFQYIWGAIMAVGSMMLVVHLVYDNLRKR